MAKMEGFGDIEKDFECSVCLDILEDPRELSCPHAFCKMCLDGMVNFYPSGEGTIKCPLCSKETFIGKTQTTKDLRSNLYLRNFGEKLKARRTDDYPYVHCGRGQCNNIVNTFCGQCGTLFCNACGVEHRLKHLSDQTTEVGVTKDGHLKVSCADHKALCDYVCNDCDNKVVCLYCVHRQHVTHHYNTVEYELKRLKDLLQNEIQRFESVSESVRDTSEKIQISRENFQKSLLHRKINGLLSYMCLLEDEEKNLLEGFDKICTTHKNEFSSVKMVDSLKSYLDLNDVQITLLKKDILTSIERDRCPLVLPMPTIRLDEGFFLSAKPLGTLQVTSEEVAFTEIGNAPGLSFNDSVNFEEKTFLQLMEKLNELSRAVEQSNGVNSTRFVTGTRLTGNETVQRNNSIPPSLYEENGTSTTSFVLLEQETMLAVAEYKKKKNNDRFESLRQLLYRNKQSICMQIIAEDRFAVKRRSVVSGATLLHFAAAYDKLDFIMYLIEIGADVSAVDHYGETFLHYADPNSHDCRKYICTTYPDMVNAKNNRGKTAYEEAVYNNNYAAIKIFREILPKGMRN